MLVRKKIGFETMFSEEKNCWKICCSEEEKHLVGKKFWSEKIFGWKKNLVGKIFLSAKCCELITQAHR